ncbi:hypothetical protein LQF12_03590 [Ruania suaedae]|uniref:hypothetical protein n=1 Tax=Ruania suaedae TaxID=2897774 RepID=UPI001E466CEA|nr:hypothetical protein [Ruania suaedae]UFU03702.1 hypothetical protein LQF12_03590 [Ruania suaedae]
MSPPPARARLSHAWARATATRWRQVGVGLALGVVLAPVGVATVGGFATADEVQVERYDVGERVELGQVDAVVVSSFVSDEVYSSGLPEGASAWAGLVVEVVNPGRDEVILSRELFRVPGVGATQEQPWMTMVVSDASVLVGLPPDVAVEVALLWPVEEAGAGGSLEVELYPVLASASFLDPGSTLWQPEALLGVVSVPIDAPPPTLVEEE